MPLNKKLRPGRTETIRPGRLFHILVALKVSELNRQGYSFRNQEFRSDFLK